MKRLTISIAILFMLAANVFAAGSAMTASEDPVGKSGYIVTISATADDTTAAFPTCLLSSASTTAINARIGREIVGKWLTSAKTKIGTIAPTNNIDIYIIEDATSTGEYILNSATLAIGVTTTAVSSVAFGYVIDAVAYTKAAVTAGTAPGNDVIPQSKYGAVAFDIGADGTIDATEATDNATGYTTAALAVAGLPAAASDHCRMGWVTATKSDGALTFGTTDLGDANTTVVYTSAIPGYDIMGGRLTNRDTTANEEVYPANTAGDNKYHFVTGSLMVVAINSDVNLATFDLELEFH